MTETVVYTGAGSALRYPDFEGAEYVFPCGVPTEAPDVLADELTQREDFAYADQMAPEPEPAEAEEAPVEAEQIPDDEGEENPEGVNAESTYGEE